MDIFYGVEIIVFLGLCIWFSRKVKKQAQESLIFYFLLFFAGIFISYVLSELYGICHGRMLLKIRLRYRVLGLP